jgi:hypothetical protein
MDIQPGEARALVFISERHPHETLSANIIMENGVGWMIVAVHEGTGNQRHRKEYLASPSGRVWHTPNGLPSGRVEPSLRVEDV